MSCFLLLLQISVWGIRCSGLQLVCISGDTTSASPAPPADKVGLLHSEDKLCRLGSGDYCSCFMEPGSLANAFDPASSLLTESSPTTKLPNPAASLSPSGHCTTPIASNATCQLVYGRRLRLRGLFRHRPECIDPTNTATRQPAICSVLIGSLRLQPTCVCAENARKAMSQNCIEACVVAPPGERWSSLCVLTETRWNRFLTGRITHQSI